MEANDDASKVSNAFLKVVTKARALSSTRQLERAYVEGDCDDDATLLDEQWQRCLELLSLCGLRWVR